MTSLLDVACMIHACMLFVLLLSLACVFPSVTMFFSLALPFMDSHGLMGSLVFGCARFSDGFETK